MPARSLLAALLAAAALVSPASAMATNPSPAVTATGSPCPRSLKFAGSLYLDTDESAPAGQVGPRIGETEPNPAQCAIPDRTAVFSHVGHNSSDEVIASTPVPGEIFRSAGQTGFPGGSLLRGLVLVLVAGIIVFAAVPAILGHLRQPPVAVGRGDTDWVEDVRAERPGDDDPPGSGL